MVISRSPLTAIMASETRPAVLVVPGGWHGPIHFDPLKGVLSSHGYPSVVLLLPTAGASPPDKDLYDDIAYISSQLEELVERGGREVIVIVHSYGGIPGSSAARPFVKKERAQQGKKGGVIGVLYISSWAMPTGKTTMEAAEGMNVDWMKIDVSDSLLFRFLCCLLLPGSNELPFRCRPFLLQRHPFCRRRFLRFKACHPMLCCCYSTSDC